MDLRNLIDEIKSRVRIEDIISRYINLKKSGKNYIALCPFHSEKTPSFTVSPEKGFYHCFGCGKSGDVFTFVSEIEKITFIEAVRKIGKEVGIDLEVAISSKNTSSEIQVLKAINSETLKFFSYYLTKSKEGQTAREYLRSRKINASLAQKFYLGYAPPYVNALYKYLKSKYYTDKSIFSSGLVLNTKSGTVDLFRDRLIIPIFNQYNEIVGFGGRVINDKEGSPKYINVPETAIFKKRNTLFGFNLAKRKAEEEKSIFLVEGYFDVISLHKLGIENVVAPLGTSFTIEQLRLLSNIVDTVYIFFDNDKAGMNAAERAIQLIVSNYDIDVKIVKTPFKDPDEFARSEKNISNPKAELLKYTIDILDFMKIQYENLLKSLNNSDKMSFVFRCFYFISLLRNVFKKSEFLRKLSEITSLREELIISEFQKYENKLKIDRESFFSGYNKSSINDMELLLAYVVSKEHPLIETLKSEVTLDSIKDETAKLYLEYLDNFLLEEDVSEECVNNLHFLQSEIESKVSHMLPQQNNTDLRETFDSLLVLYKLKVFKERRKQIKEIIERISQDQNASDFINELLEERNVIAREENNIKVKKGINYV